MRDPMYYSDDSDPAGAGFGRRRRGRRGFGPGGFGPRGGGAPGFGPGPRGFGGGFGRGTFGPASQEAAEGRDHPHHHGHHHGPDEAAFGPRRFGPGGPGGTDGPGGFGPRGFGPGGFGPGGFGPGPGGFGSGGFGPRGFGPGGFGPGGHGGRRGGRRQRGNVRIAVLALLAEEPRHGYSIMTELAERSGGLWRPSPGSIYPVLQQLQDEGLVTSQDSEGRKVFSLTDAGRTLVTDNPAEYEQPWSMADAGPGLRIKVLFQGMTALGAAVQQVARLGTADQAERAGAVLEEARRNLYRILAEDTAGASLDGSDGPEYGSAGAPSTGPEDDASGDVEQDR